MNKKHEICIAWIGLNAQCTMYKHQISQFQLVLRGFFIIFFFRAQMFTLVYIAWKRTFCVCGAHLWSFMMIKICSHRHIFWLLLSLNKYWIPSFPVRVVKRTHFIARLTRKRETVLPTAPSTNAKNEMKKMVFDQNFEGKDVY